VDYVEALRRVKMLLIARNAIVEALDDAMEDLNAAAAAEGRTVTVSTAPPPPRPARPPAASGMRHRFELPDDVEKKEIKSEG
jgi:hypothetical protein